MSRRRAEGRIAGQQDKLGRGIGQSDWIRDCDETGDSTGY